MCSGHAHGIDFLSYDVCMYASSYAIAAVASATCLVVYSEISCHLVSVASCNLLVESVAVVVPRFFVVFFFVCG